MDNLIYRDGDATVPQAEGNTIIAHLCNDIGAWGAGFVIAVSNKWPKAKAIYRKAAVHRLLKLGLTQFVLVEDDPARWIANMVGQNGINDGKNGWFGDLVDYTALTVCLRKVFEFAIQHSATIHMPKIGSKLAGGDWSRIEGIIAQLVSEYGVDCYVYNYDLTTAKPGV